MKLLNIKGNKFPFFRRFVKSQNLNKCAIVMGGILQKQKCREENEQSDENIEKYFRPSCFAVLNNRFHYQFFDSFFNKKYNQIVLSPLLMNSPENTIINYFSVLREAENLTKDKSGGCGTVGMSKIPYPIAYNFFTNTYQEKISYNRYFRSFKGIGHINLIKLASLHKDKNYPNAKRYFIEIETIEGSAKGVTYFAYYYGYIYMEKEKNSYKIANMELYGEDFLCAAYHLWQHNAEAVVDAEYGNWCKLVKERLPTKQEGYTKQIDVIGTDGYKYRFVFFQLTNHTDILTAQYKKNTKGKWEFIEIDPEKCL
ncbi:hypothetical protein BACCIP111899_03823 [Bacillus rhizoplanae]|uniref:Uncharacterized protein n=1 Tax=Bacillus rhizoplanae TaxID=2880966 RepID=A0ABM8YFJ4_9BACI|nr:hypothetical protein [Bacillus rhizoplanae]CAG9614590.1 hypothetical protein BACCIP111899_03823 [Bacillus rhizoplanae]